MSLIKARNFKVMAGRNLELIKGDFIGAVNGCFMAIDTLSPKDIAYLVKYYAEYSAYYLREVAKNLKEPKDSQQTMKFMNSYIATMMHEADLHYFNKEHGFSIIDKAVQMALEKDFAQLELEDIFNIIDEIEQSYVEITDDNEEALAA